MYYTPFVYKFVMGPVPTNGEVSACDVSLVLY